jgi:hypothetical protein
VTDIIDKDFCSDIEELILMLPSILNCKVVINHEGKLVEIHILANKRRSPKQIARDIQSSVMAKWGLQIDYKIISIAQIEDTSQQEEKRGYKLVISSVEYSVEGINGEAVVVLKSEDKTYTGKIKGLHTRSGVTKLIANATIRAVEDYMGQGPCFYIEDIERTQIAKKDVVLIVVTLLTNFGEKYFVGISFLDADIYKSIVKATLNALDSYIEDI